MNKKTLLLSSFVVLTAIFGFSDTSIFAQDNSETVSKIKVKIQEQKVEAKNEESKTIIFLNENGTENEKIKVKFDLTKDILIKINELRDRPIANISGTPVTIQPLITQDDKTMGFVVKGTEKEIAGTKNLLKALDKELNKNIERLNIQFIKLKTAKAEEVAADLNIRYSKRREQAQISGDAPTLVPEKIINALLVIGASKDEYKFIQDAVESLDKPTNERNEK